MMNIDRYMAKIDVLLYQDFFLSMTRRGNFCVFACSPNRAKTTRELLFHVLPGLQPTDVEYLV